jgi:hypothetical protein
MAKDTYVDIYGRSHITSKIVSSGGQGIVYMTEDPNVLLKLEWNPITKEIKKDLSNNDKFDNIRVLPLLEKTNLTLPQTILRDVVGYTMKMLDGMVSFEEAFNGENYEFSNNIWISSIKKENEYWGDKLQKYIATGGMRKRLNAFLNTACILSKIHASGLVYCDISGKNMFVSSEPNKSNVWLIDSDNLNFMKNTIKKKDGGLHTPGFGAPEVYEGNGKTMYSDAFSFAIALFWELTQTHPFIGVATQKALDELDMLDFPEEDYACNGTFAWICDENDRSNEPISESPDLFLSKPLFDKFQKTFSELGRKNKQKRTIMPEWTHVLAKELDHIVRCKHCQMDYYGNTNTLCPWCDTQNNVLIVNSYKVVESQKVIRWEFLHEIIDYTLSIPLRVLEGVFCNHLEENAFKISYCKDSIEVSDLTTQYDFFIKNQDKQIYGSTKFNTKDKIELLAINKKNNNNYFIEIEVK